MDGKQQGKEGEFFRQRLKNHFKCFEFIIYVFIGAFAVSIYLKIETEINAIKYFYPFLLLSLLPVVYLYFEYLYFNPLTSRVEIDSDGRRIIFFEGTSFTEIGFDEITEIRLNRSPSWSRADRVQMLPFEQLRYTRVLTEDKSVIITCLLVDSLEESFNKIAPSKVVNQIRLFPSILLE